MKSRKQVCLINLKLKADKQIIVQTMSRRARRARRQSVADPESKFADHEESKHSHPSEMGDDEFEVICDNEVHNSNCDSDWEDRLSKSTDVSDEIKRLLEHITENYKLTYRDIRDSQHLREAPLNTLTL